MKCLAGVLLLAACMESPIVDPQRPTAVTIETPAGDALVNVEVLYTKTKIRRGLMERAHLMPDHGALFMMGNEKVWEFWMRDTWIPLDMIFIARDLTVAGIVHRAAPHSDEPRGVDAPSVYVLEVNAGWAAAHKVRTGAKVRFENIRR